MPPTLLQTSKLPCCAALRGACVLRAALLAKSYSCVVVVGLELTAAVRSCVAVLGFKNCEGFHINICALLVLEMGARGLNLPPGTNLRRPELLEV